MHPFPIPKQPLSFFLLSVIILMLIGPTYGITWEWKRKRTPEQKTKIEADSLYILGRKMYNRGNLDSAEVLLKGAIKLRDFDPDYYAALGMIYDRANKFDQARQWYLESVKADGNRANMYYQIARLYIGQDSLAAALPYLDKYVKDYTREAEPALSKAQAEKVIGQITQRLKEEEMIRQGDTLTH